MVILQIENSFIWWITVPGPATRTRPRFPRDWKKLNKTPRHLPYLWALEWGSADALATEGRLSLFLRGYRSREHQALNPYPSDGTSLRNIHIFHRKIEENFLQRPYDRIINVYLLIYFLNLLSKANIFRLSIPYNYIIQVINIKTYRGKAKKQAGHIWDMGNFTKHANQICLILKYRQFILDPYKDNKIKYNNL